MVKHAIAWRIWWHIFHHKKEWLDRAKQVACFCVHDLDIDNAQHYTFGSTILHDLVLHQGERFFSFGNPEQYTPDKINTIETDPPEGIKPVFNPNNYQEHSDHATFSPYYYPETDNVDFRWPHDTDQETHDEEVGSFARAWLWALIHYYAGNI